jgi:hypothetical protein
MGGDRVWVKLTNMLSQSTAITAMAWSCRTTQDGVPFITQAPSRRGELHLRAPGRRDYVMVLNDGPTATRSTARIPGNRSGRLQAGADGAACSLVLPFFV